MKLPGIFQKLSNLLQPQKTLAEGLCSITISPVEIAVAKIQHRTEQAPLLTLCESVPYSTPVALVSTLTQLVNEYNLQGSPCSWILQPYDYELLLIEALPVAPEEIQTAVRWRIKELSRFATEEAVIDTFPALTQGINEQQQMLYVVVAHAPTVQNMANQINASGLQLTAIDIPELSLRNINSLFETNGTSTALIYLKPINTDLIITQQNCLYLSRQLPLGLNDATTDTSGIMHLLDQLSSEMLRSFDYFQVQLHQDFPARLLLATQLLSQIDIIDYLSKKLNHPAQLLDLNQVLTLKQPLTLAQQNHCLPVIGGALRKEATQHVS